MASPLLGSNRASVYTRRHRGYRPTARFVVVFNGEAPASRRSLLSAAALSPCCCAACAAAQPRSRNSLIDRFFAAGMAEGMQEYEAQIAPVKRRLFTELLSNLPAAAPDGQPPQLLELGIGTGPNLPYYADFYGLPKSMVLPTSRPDSSGGSSPVDNGSFASSSTAGSPQPPLHITGLDPNPFMRPYLEDSLQAVGWPGDRMTWREGEAEAMPLPDASFDAVVCTLVLCSVSDVTAALLEVQRVLRPGGAFLFIEHTGAPRSRPLLGLAQRVLSPLQQVLADNCHLTRDPLPPIQAAPAFAGAVQSSRFSLEGGGLALISPHVAGIARRLPSEA